MASSRNVDGDANASNPAMVDYWLGHSHRFCNAETRREGMGATVINTAASVVASSGNNASDNSTAQNDAKKVEKSAVDHPLAMAEEEEKAESPTPPLTVTSSKLRPVTAANIAAHLTSNDIDRVRIFVRE